MVYFPRIPPTVEEEISRILARNFLTDDPDPVIRQLQSVAGDNPAVLAELCGVAAGFFRSDKTAALCAAIIEEIDGAEAWVQVGWSRRQRAINGGRPDGTRSQSSRFRKGGSTEAARPSAGFGTRAG